MFGAFIGDIAGSKYEFNPIKTKNFSLLSNGCDFTDDSIMTAAVAKAIMLSREERYRGGKRPYQDILVETMQEYGRRYPHPKGAYGGKFTKWLTQKDPKPYGSFGNGAAMRVSPCALFAINMDEALSLARATTVVSHDHPEGIRGAEAVAAAVYLAKAGCSKEEIRDYIEKYYYRLNFTLDSIRASYRFDASCQGCVPQAIVAFLESDSFEDAIRNIISIGGDCDTTGAITGSIAWTYYAVETGSDYNLKKPGFETMQAIRDQFSTVLPEEFVVLAESFREAAMMRAGTYYRVGGCTSILSDEEWERFGKQWTSPFASPTHSPCDGADIDQRLKKQLDPPGDDYFNVVSADYIPPTWEERKKKILDEMRASGITPVEPVVSIEPVVPATPAAPVASARSARTPAVPTTPVVPAAASDEKAKSYSLQYFFEHPQTVPPRTPGSCEVVHDVSMKKWRFTFQLEEQRLYFLSVFIHENDVFDMFSFDEEYASDSHYQFKDEEGVRKALYRPGDEDKLLHEIFIEYLKDHKSSELITAIWSYITAEFHYD